MMYPKIMAYVVWPSKVTLGRTFFWVLFFLKLSLFYVYECFNCMYVCAPHVCNAHRGQKVASVLLELELHMVVSG